MYYYNTGYTLKAKDLFCSFPLSKYIKRSEEETSQSWYKVNMISKISQIFIFFFKLVLDDIIDNNVTFKLPPGTRAYIEMVPVKGDDFVKARQNGAFKDVDFLASNFTGNQIQFRISTRYGKWLKRIYVGNAMKNRITENTNKGKQYG